MPYGIFYVVGGVEKCVAISGRLLKEARESRGGTSQGAVAEAIGCEQSYVSKLENDKMQGGIKGDELLKLARFLNYDPHVFSGELSFQDGDLRNAEERKTLSMLVAKIAELESKVAPAHDTDPLFERIQSNRELRELVDSIKFMDSVKLRELHGVVFGYMAKDSIASQREPAAESRAG